MTGARDVPARSGLGRVCRCERFVTFAAGRDVPRSGPVPGCNPALRAKGIDNAPGLVMNWSRQPFNPIWVQTKQLLLPGRA